VEHHEEAKMPIYLYQCEACGVRFERMQRMSEDPVTECPECGGETRRVIQPVGVIFKGSGFYITDNRQVSSPTLAPPKSPEKPGEKQAAESADTQHAHASQEETAQKGKDVARGKDTPAGGDV
jgi:putative FmdB family regulatory protein